MAFSFAFSGDDIEEDSGTSFSPAAPPPQAAEQGSLQKRQGGSSSSSSTAFPIAGHDLLAATQHELAQILGTLPERISYSTLEVRLDDGATLRLPRRELWDVRVQIMAEDEGGGAGEEGLGSEDVKTGVYEGGFKSWECSVDLVRVLASRRGTSRAAAQSRVLEMGCGTALPSLALLQWALQDEAGCLELTLADYNPSVLRLVTVPNALLSWAYVRAVAADGGAASSWEADGELDITPALLASFQQDLAAAKIELRLLSGAWGDAFVELYSRSGPRSTASSSSSNLLVLAAETIYSPAALQSFARTLTAILRRDDDDGGCSALVGAKKVYFGVGGSMQDFCALVEGSGAVLGRIREEEGGVRREVVEVFGRGGAEGGRGE